MKHKHSACIPSFIHLCTQRDKTVKENHLKTGADRRQRKMSLPGKVGEMSHAVEMCVYMFLQTVSSLGVYSSCTSRTFTSSHLLTLLPESQHHAILLLNPSSHSRCKFLCTVLNIYFPFPRPLVSNLSFSIFRPALFLNLCSERPKMVSFALSICHSSLVPPYLKLFDSITIST